MSSTSIIPHNLSVAERSIILRMGLKKYVALAKQAIKIAERAQNGNGLSEEDRERFLEIPFFVRKMAIDEVTLNQI